MVNTWKSNVDVAFSIRNESKIILVSWTTNNLLFFFSIKKITIDYLPLIKNNKKIAQICGFSWTHTPRQFQRAWLFFIHHLIFFIVFFLILSFNFDFLLNFVIQI